jgi:hypothetical protein
VRSIIIANDEKILVVEDKASKSLPCFYAFRCFFLKRFLRFTFLLITSSVPKPQFTEAVYFQPFKDNTALLVELFFVAILRQGAKSPHA